MTILRFNRPRYSFAKSLCLVSFLQGLVSEAQCLLFKGMLYGRCLCLLRVLRPGLLPVRSSRLAWQAGVDVLRACCVCRSVLSLFSTRLAPRPSTGMT